MLLPLLTLVLAAAPAQDLTSLDAHALDQRSARFAPVDLAVDLSKLPESERHALAELVRAAQPMDAIILEQLWGGNVDVLARLAADSSPLGRARLHAFLQNKGPWMALDANAPFVPGVPVKPPQAGFYPLQSTKAEIEKWLATLPGDARKDATGFYSVVRRGPDGKFVTVPFSTAYQQALEISAAHLRAAAQATQDATLKRFLESRADAFSSNDYYASDVAWMELDSALDPTIGPYEVYNDEWFNAKAAFEAFINVRDEAETQRLAHLSGELQDIENHLPIDDKYKNPKLGALAPIRVVNEVFASGDAAKGVQTAAYNLPNDERITDEKGTKRVMLKNVQEAKFKTVLQPIAKIALAPADQKNLAFDAFFTHILMHELMHGLGPHMVKTGAKQVTVREALQDSYSALEESKADISGLFAMQYLVDKGVLPKTLARTMYTTYLASAFRSIRFGLEEAHGKGVAMQINYLLDHGGLEVRGGRLAVVPGKIQEAVKGLTHEFMTIQAEGDVAKAQQMLATLGVVRPPIQHILDQIAAVPVDIAPRFVTAEKLAAGK
jgi:hypothetical protein